MLLRRQQDFTNIHELISGMDHRVCSDGSQHNIGGEQAATVEGVSNANPDFDAIKLKMMEFKMIRLQLMYSHLIQQ